VFDQNWEHRALGSFAPHERLLLAPSWRTPFVPHNHFNSHAQFHDV
jgi:hypothetical protein